MWHSNRILSLAPLILASMIASMAMAQVRPNKAFSYGGLDRSTTVEELRARYPTSPVTGRGHFRLSDEDSHDHIYAIQASQDAATIGLYFGREVPDSKPRRYDYELCDHVVSTITRDYGDPSEVADGSEEEMLTRRFTWRQPAETVTVYCFYSCHSDRYYAEWLRIEPCDPGVEDPLA